MYYSYVLKSKDYYGRYYYGYSSNVHKRLVVHNNNEYGYTSNYSPWKLIFYAAFETQYLAMKFERYLKTSSGKAFLRKRLINYGELYDVPIKTQRL